MITVIAAMIEREGTVLIGKRRSDEKNFPNKWEFPGGKLKKGETHTECLLREIMEECGIAVVVGDLIASSTHRYKDLAVELFIYHCLTDAIDFTSNAHDVLAWATADEFKNYDLLDADIALLPRITAFIR